uniref:uncharacterized protein LOC120331383 n=1 Tax=Styela clava TaxID=7725 RepID=UPI001939C721|nr:uncharacterized protein LOC120331383 [Styela clava]
MAGRRQCTEFDADEALFRILEESDVDDDNYEDSDMSSSEEEMIDRDSDSESEQTTPMADISSTSTSVPLPKRARKRGRPVVSPPQPEFNWGKIPPKRTIPQFGGAAGIRSRGISPTSSPLDCFMQFSTVQVINLIVDMTNLNAEKMLQGMSNFQAIKYLFLTSIHL